MSDRMRKWEKMHKKPVAKPTQPSESAMKRGEKEVKEYINGMSTQIRKYGERIPYKELQEVYDFLFDNKEDLITALDHYLRTYLNPKRQPARPGGITDRRNNRIIKIHEFLINLKKNRIKTAKQ